MTQFLKKNAIEEISLPLHERITSESTEYAENLTMSETETEKTKTNINFAALQSKGQIILKELHKIQFEINDAGSWPTTMKYCIRMIIIKHRVIQMKNMLPHLLFSRSFSTEYFMSGHINISVGTLANGNTKERR